jgi:trehalose-phosphatase
VRTLFLDLDGTLAPLAAAPALARVLPGIPHSLGTLARRGWRVVIVSGRPRTEARRLCPVPGALVFGSHGLEGPGVVRKAVTLRARLHDLARGGATLARKTPGARVEQKPWGVAFHDRNVSASHLAVWRRRLRAFLSGCDLEGLEILRGRRVLEIRPRGAHKGRVVALLFPEGFGGRRDASLVAVGDDVTDEDLFRAVRGAGIAVRVGRPRRRTAATRRLPSPGAVARFLGALAGRASG